jgi:hypothetical protein
VRLLVRELRRHPETVVGLTVFGDLRVDLGY